MIVTTRVVKMQRRNGANNGRGNPGKNNNGMKWWRHFRAVESHNLKCTKLNCDVLLLLFFSRLSHLGN